MYGVVNQLLKNIGLEVHYTVFEKEKIDYNAFLLLNNNDLQDMKIPIGDRKKILAKIERIKNPSNRGKKLSHLMK